MRKNISWYLAAALFSAMLARAAIISYNQPLVSTPALGYNATYTLDLQANGIGQVSAQAVYSSATIANVTFTDGSQSTGSFTVGNYAALAASSATDTVTVGASPGASAALNINGHLFINNQDWANQGSGAANATALAADINSRFTVILSTKPGLATSTVAVTIITASASGNVITLTAPLGSAYNSWPVTSNDPALVVANPTLTGGADSGYVTINGATLGSSSFTAVTSNATTATNLATAINNVFENVLTAQASGNVVTATSTLCGATYNYSFLSSNSSAISAVPMINGTNSGASLSTTVFASSLAGNFTTALPVLYTTSSNSGFAGLTDNTTYYAVPLSPVSFQLAKYSTSAVVDAAGGSVDFVKVTSSNSQVTAHTYTLSLTTPYTGFTQSTALTWSQSFDNANWTTLTTSSATSTTGTSSTTFWNFGSLGARYLRANVNAPTTGAESVTITILGTP